MKKITIFLFLLYSGILQAQLSINNTLLTPSQLVQNVLVGQGVTPLNIKFNGTFVDALAVKDQVGKFTTNFNPTNLGLNEGVIMTTGKAIGALGPNSVGNFTNPSVTPVEGDADLALLSGKTIRTKAILEFDFYATGLVLNFDFVFGSDEYPEWVNTAFNDVFGFFLSGPGITGPYSNNSKNIALVPNTNIGVSIDNVNAGSNSNWFVTNTQQHVQYDGFTKPIRATSALQCGGLYHIKLAIANAGDNAYDSGVFLKNFSIPPMEIIDNYGLSANPNVCFGETITLDSGYATGTGFVFVWTLDGDIIAGNGPTLDVSVGGIYGLTVYTATACQLAQDEIVIAYRPPMPITSPQDINLCTTAPLPLTVNINQTSSMLGTQPASEYYVSYYNSSYNDAFYGVPTGVIANSSLSNYTVNSVPTTVWARFEEVNGVACVTVKPIEITNVIPTGTIAYTPVTYCNTITAAQTITPSTLTPGGSYSATPPGLLIDPSTGAITPNGSTPGPYQVDYVITGSCPYTTSTSVVIEPCVCTVVATNSGPICSDAASFNLFASSAGAGYSYSWTGPNGFTSNVQNPTGVPLPTGLPPFIYEVTSTLGVDTCVGQTTLVVNALPTITGTPTVCVNSTTQLTGSAAPSSTTPWTSSNVAVATVDNTGLVTGVSDGVSTITFTNSNGCIITKLVTVNALPTVSVNSPSVCILSSATITASPGIPGSYDYVWTVPVGAVNPGNVASFNAITPGIYGVTITRNNLLCNGDFETTQVVSAGNNVSVNDAVFPCWKTTAPDHLIDVWGSGHASVDSYSGNQFIAFDTAASVILYQDFEVIPQSTATISFAHRGRVGIDVIEVQIGPIGGPYTSLGTFSDAQTWQYHTISYTFPSGTTSYRIRFVPISSAGGPSGGNFIDKVSLNINSCPSLEALATFTVNNLPTITGTPTVCVNSTTQLIGSATPATTTPWTSSNTAVATVDSTGLVTGITAGTTTITYTNSNGCMITEVVTVNALPTITGTPTVCEGLSTQLTGSSAPSTTTPWTSSTPAVATVDNTGLVTAITAGTTTITYMDSNGCIITEVVTVNSLPTITGNATICQGLTTQLTGSAAPSTTTPWTSSNVAVATVDNTGLVTGITAGTTTITYMNSNGCIITEVVLVKSPPTAVVNSPIACLGATVTLTATSGLPGTYSYAWTVPLGAVPPGDVASFTTSVAGTYSVVLTDIITTCSSTSASGIVTLNAIPFAVATPLGQTICSGQTTGISLSSSVFGTVFNWTAVQVDATGATSGTGGIISQALTATGLVPATVSYTVIPTANGCTGPAMVVTITVMPTPVATATPVVQTICSGGTTAIVLTSDLALPTFNWNVIQTGVTGASAGSGSTINQVLSAIGNSVGEAVYSITPIVSGCPGTPITVSITVNPIPVITASPSTATICSGETTNISLSSTLAGTTYNWSVIQTGVLGALPGSGSSISQVLTTVGILPGSVQYTITPITGGCIGLPITVTITVNPTPELFAFATAGICSGESPNITLSPNLPATTFAWTVVQTGVSGALDGTGASIDQVLTNTGTNPGTVVYTVTPSANGCSGTAVDITVTVDPLPLPAIQPGVICVEEASGIAFQTYELNTQLSGSTHTFVWYLNGVIIPGAAGSSYEALEAGSYSVIATNNTTGCISLPLSVTVSETFPGQGITTTQTLAFADNAQVTVEVTGTGVYEYQLDNGMFQSSNIFENVGIGPHTIWVRDTDGCTDLTTTIYIIGYPHYFTPNGDGVHDQWNIIGLSNQPNAKIYIFDRYGKLIKQISPTSQGWDGTRNGEPLPATDYWFTVDYFEAGTDKVFKSHFSLKR